jgi:1,4-alpha-glucan branching enzyme
MGQELCPPLIIWRLLCDAHENTAVSMKERRCGMSKSTKRISFSVYAPKAKKVFVSGTFNNWARNLEPMKKTAKGVWMKRKRLLPGKHEYKFLIDGEWMPDPSCGDTVKNAFGTLNSVVIV